VHCGYCCLELRKNKNGSVPKHYVTETHFWNWVQKECRGSGTFDYVESPYGGRCQRKRSRTPCPCCGQRLTLKRDGRFPAHNADGTECNVSRGNR
jgi:hypothetical protein